MDITVHSIRPAVDYAVSNRADIMFIVFGAETATVVAPNQSGAIVSVSGGYSSAQIGITAEGDLYGLPYFSQDGTGYVYYSWAALSGSGWLARRVLDQEPFTQDEIEATSGPQPETLADFEGLTW